jgi:RNA polymerase sigma-70 factor, ECF subfamily
MAPGRDTDDLGDLRALHAAHAGPLYAFALYATGDRGAAEEIVQDTFVHAWRAADRFDPAKGDVRNWLFAIARNLATDHHRRRAARPVLPTPDERLEESSATASDIDRAVEAWNVAQALSQLTPAHREAIVEVHLRGASVVEAARRLSIPPGTVKSRVYYGLRSLRVALEELGAVR